MTGNIKRGGTTAALLMGALLILGTSGCGHKKSASGGGRTAPGAPSTAALKVGVIPFEDISKIKENYKPFADYLGKKTGGRTAEVFVTPEYTGIIQALGSDQIDCAYLNPLSYAIAVQEFKDKPEHLIPIALPVFHGKPTYLGIIYVRADSGINSIKDLKGKSFAFGDRTSTSGYLYPAAMFKEAGIDPNRDVRAENVTGPGNVLAVFNKNVDGGASFEGAIEAFLKDPAKAKQLKIIATTEPIPNGMLVARGNLDPAVIDKLKAALVSINTDADGKDALKKMEDDAWVPADDKVFDSVRTKATVLNLHLDALDAPKK